MNKLQIFLSPSSLTRHPEVLLTIAVGIILGILIVPVPTAVLDILLATNMAFAALILVSVLLSEKPLAVSSFPTLLLITTVFRLGLNVSTTRSILSEGTAGEVVDAFGHFVARGDVAMGLVVFIVLTLVQLMVIGKGAERVAEVGARFTLDAMPGKQMSIDAALRNGAITEKEAEDKRVELGRESQFYGAMDGAMKFVKGDATVGIVVTVINLIAGLLIGVFRFDMTLFQAAETFAILTIGDGLVSQIPSLLIALASGMLTTRVASNIPKHDLGRVLGAELLGSPKVLGLSALFALAIGLVPGMPTVPFVIIATALAVGAFLAHRQAHAALHAQETDKGADFDKALEERKKMAKAQKAVSDQLAPTVPIVGIDLDSSLSKALGFGQGQDDETELMSDWMSQVRDAIFSESGVRLPGVRVKSFCPGLSSNTAIFKIKDVPVAVESFRPDRALALASVDDIKKLGVEGEAAVNPLSDGPACLIAPELTQSVTGAGVQVLTCAGVISLFLVKVARDHVSEFIGLQETAEGLKRLEQVCPELVSELVPNVVSVSQLRDVLRQLVRERVSIRDLKSILEGLGQLADRSADIITLTNHVRSCLALQLTHQLAGSSLRLGVVILEPLVEELIGDSIVHTQSGSHVALEPEMRDTLMRSLERTFRPIQRAGVKAVLITQSSIRFFVHSLLEMEGKLPNVAVVSYDELRSDLILQPLGCVRMDPQQRVGPPKRGQLAA